MTVLGFLGIVSYFINQSGVLVTIGTKVWGSDEERADELGETFETIHMMIFLVMCLFICQVAVLVWVGNMAERRWKRRP